ncbi:MAG TPA: VWA domain-containing protein [Myxococcota bacterium]|nr:VWA domain-containing protein [Myxococcota bacterium]
MTARITIASFLSLLLAGCAGLDLELRNASVQKPGNVALYFSVETGDGLPVAGLTAESFHIFEDDQLISPFESKQTILNPKVAVVSYIVLLMDLSGSITESGSLPALIDAASTFAERVARTHRVAVFGFDGGPKLIPVVDFTTNPRVVQSGLKRLTHRKVKDPSTNLNGAVVESVKEIEQRMAGSSQPLRFGTLVIFTDGADRAHRVSEDAVYDVLDESKTNVFVIGLGPEISEDQLARLGRTGFVKAAAVDVLGLAFDKVAAQIEAAGRKFYLLSYCSPSRAGLHTLRVEANSAGLDGALEHDFTADGFGPKCNPKKAPVFSVGRIRIK